MYLLWSLALAGFLAFCRVGGWERKDDYYEERECAQKERFDRLNQNSALNQCHSSPNPKGPKGKEDCKTFLQKHYNNGALKTLLLYQLGI